MKIISLSRKNLCAMIDDQDFERVSQLKWHARETKWTTYAQAHIRRAGIDTTVQLHRFILSITDPKIQIDHKNHEGLDCQRDNLRIATASQNSANARKAPGTISRFKGVTWHKPTSKWAAQIIHNRQHRWLGVFHSEEDAAKAYWKAAKKEFGEFACISEEISLELANG